MGKNSPIGWTGDTDNVIVVKGGGWWCRMCSEGCAHCYAADLNQNAFYGGNMLPYTGKPPELILREDILAGWARQKRSRLHFVCSMTDVFGDWVPVSWQFRILDAMAAATCQVFQLLTKRPRTMAVVIEDWINDRGFSRFPWNIWPGCSVENQPRADERRDPMARLAEMGGVTWVSYEPALGPIDWSGWKFLKQIIAGGESGKHARPAHPEWFRNTRDFCTTNSIAFFFKQWGEWLPDHARTFTTSGKITWGLVHVGGGFRLVLDRGVRDWKQSTTWHEGETGVTRFDKAITGRNLDGCTWSQFPAIDHPALKGRETIATS